MANTTELVGVITRQFPNIMTITLLVGGILLAKIPWIMAATGAIVTTLAITAIFHLGLSTILSALGPSSYVVQLFSTMGLYGSRSAAGIEEVCALVPTLGIGGSIITGPSLWIALMSFYLTYVMANAVSVFTTKPANAKADTIPVAQRQGIGIVSILATAIFFLLMVTIRATSSCETISGSIAGVTLGAIGGYSWWRLMTLCGDVGVFPDIHGVMTGLNPAQLKTSPLACVPPSGKTN
jgi:hypothetical protein